MRVEGSGFRVQGSGFRAQGSEFRVQKRIPSGHIVIHLHGTCAWREQVMLPMGTCCESLEHVGFDSL